MNRSLREDLINDLHTAINRIRMASDKAGQGRIADCRENLEWVDKALRGALQRLKVTDEVREMR